MSENPYQTPNSPPPTVSSLHKQPLSLKQLSLVAWLCIGLAIFDIALSIMTLSPEWENITNAIGMAYAFIAIYVLLAFNRFLNKGLDITGTAKIILPIIIFGIVYAILPLINAPDIEFENSSLSLTDSIFIVSLIPYGILNLLLGRKLQESKIAYPHLNTIAWLHIITGICMASLVLLLVAIPLSIAINIYMAQLFFHAHHESSNKPQPTTEK